MAWKRARAKQMRWTCGIVGVGASGENESAQQCEECGEVGDRKRAEMVSIIAGVPIAEPFLLNRLEGHSRPEHRSTSPPHNPS